MTTSKNPNHADKSRGDAKSAAGECSMMKAKVQLLPLRYGLVERLDPTKELNLPYKLKSRPLGIRLLRDGYLYVIDNVSGYLHEYRVEQGAVSKFIWKGSEAAQDIRKGTVAEPCLVFPRNSLLHVCFSEIQWTAYKCSQMLKSRADRDLFMQRVDLAKADCEKGGAHLLTDVQAGRWLAEVAEQPANQPPPPGAHAEESQDYVWEHQALYRRTGMGAVKHKLLDAYRNDYLFLVLKDSIGVMRDLAEEQDRVVNWIEAWSGQQQQELKFVIGSYIETLMLVGEDIAQQAGLSEEFFQKTTPEQREKVYDYLNARNELTWERRKNPEKAHYPGRGYDPHTIAARQRVASKRQAMIDALGKDLYAELEDDIENLEEQSHGTLEGRGWGARGIHDLVRHEEMRKYLAAERTHLKRWLARLERISEDRVKLFTAQEFHLSAWYYDFDHPDQQRDALLVEQNCTRDICRNEEALVAIGEYFHTYPYYVLPAFQTRLTSEFLAKQLQKLIKWLEKVKGYQKSLAKALARQDDIDNLLGIHWTKSLNLAPDALQLSTVVNAAYIPALSSRSDKWLQQAKRQHGELNSLLDELDNRSNRGQRLGHLLALRQQGAWLEDTTPEAHQRYKDKLQRFLAMLKDEDELVRLRDQAQRDSRRRRLDPATRERAKLEKQQYNQALQKIANERSRLLNELQEGMSVTSTLEAARTGIRIRGLNSTQQQMLEDEIRRMRSGQLGGYATQGTYKAALKSAFLPSLLLYGQVKNAMAATETWLQIDKSTLKEDLIFWGAISSALSAGLSVYQNAHIVMVDTVLKGLNTGGQTRSGALFAVRLGKLGLALGTPISGLAFVGALGSALQNWSKWTDAFRTGSAGERAGAFLAMSGDIGVTAVNGLQAGRGVMEFSMLRKEAASLARQTPGMTQKAARAAAWATRGPRFMSYVARLSPWGLAFTGFQIAGEVLYNYHNLDAHQRWMLHCCWGTEPDPGWDWAGHYQRLAEATLQPVISDQGIQQATDGEWRVLRLSLPGQRAASLREHPLLFTAELRRELDQAGDVGQALQAQLRLVATEPLVVDLRVPFDWQGLGNQLLLRLACQPEMAGKPLNTERGYLYYRIPLSVGNLNKPIQALAESPRASTTPLGWTAITPEHLHG